MRAINVSSAGACIGLNYRLLVLSLDRSLGFNSACSGREAHVRRARKVL
jgi:hypothetical protein